MRVPSAIVCIAAASLLPLLAGCFDRALEPKPVPLDRVDCARCGMMVSEEGDSAQWVADGEEPRFYDDIGCLAADDWKPASRNARFVHVDGTRWAPAANAFYARPPHAATPMGYGVVAFGTREKAAALDREGRARTWNELIAELESAPPDAGAPQP